MASIDELFRKPHLPSSKRKFEAPTNPEASYKATKHNNGDVKANSRSPSPPPIDDDGIEAGPEPPSAELDDEEDGRFFGGGITKGASDALTYVEEHEGAYREEHYDIAWLRRLGLSFERTISKNAELRAKYGDEPQKFMSSEADLDAEIKALSILSEHPELYSEFARIGCAGSLVSLLAHDNTDIAIGAMEIISELLDDNGQADQGQWDSLVNAMIEGWKAGERTSYGFKAANPKNRRVLSLDRFDETNEADRSGVYFSLSVLDSLSSQPTFAEKVGTKPIVTWLLSRAKVKEANGVSQNKQYSAEVLSILLQSSSVVRRLAAEELEAVDTFLTLLAVYRKRDPEKESNEEQFVDDIFNALTCLVVEASGKRQFVANEGVELCLIMLREGRLAKRHALRVLDHACSGSGAATTVCETLVEAAGLKVIFALFMNRKTGKEDVEHLLGIFAALLRQLPGESPARIRTLAKFVEKDYEKVVSLVKLRRDYASRVAAADNKLVDGDADARFSGRLEAGLYCLQTIDVVLAWLVAEDDGCRHTIQVLLAEKEETLTTTLKATIEEQLKGLEDDDPEVQETREMLGALVEFLD
ncbi:hypothetical protein LTR50_005131 [Elasticomyces elasticus]|nr:hypothetical protein LTR50_005131 [Elasticomyces elasticus]